MTRRKQNPRIVASCSRHLPLLTELFEAWIVVGIMKGFRVAAGHSIAALLISVTVLTMAPSTLAHWAKADKAGKLGKIGNTRKPSTEVEMELARTKRELVEVKMERDIQEEAAAYSDCMKTLPDIQPRT